MFNSNKTNDIEKKLSGKIAFMVRWFAKRVDFNIT